LNTTSKESAFFNKKRRKRLVWVQKFLSEKITKSDRIDRETKLPDRELAWYTSIKCEAAGAWLNVIPKSILFTFNDDDFAAALCYLYY
jgi:hypothetical protein